MESSHFCYDEIWQTQYCLKVQNEQIFKVSNTDYQILKGAAKNLALYY